MYREKNVLRRRFTLLTALWVISVAGCSGGESGPNLAKVTGVVTFGGKPMAQTKVLFEPQSSTGPSWGMTDAEGKFEVYYTPRQPGATLGKHRVQFQRTLMDEESAAGSQPAIPKKYAFGSPGIEVEVGEGPNEFQFDLEK